MDTRAGEAGKMMAEAIKEMANPMYQNNTKRNFYSGLMEGLSLEVEAILSEFKAKKQESEN